MNIPVSNDLSTKRGLVEVWIEETMSLDFDLSGEGEYVDTGAVEGEIQADFEINRTGLLDRLDRAESPSIKDQINMFLEDWSADSIDTDIVELDYGRLLLKGAEPTELPSEIDLGSTFPSDEIRGMSPEDLKRELRKEQSYETTYEDLAEDVGAYLEREGITVDPTFSAPVHLQASAIPAEDGTDFTIVVENNELSAIEKITVKVEMSQGIGREVTLGHAGDHSDEWTSEPAVSGRYDPEEGTYNFAINSLSPAGDGGSQREIRFHVPARARKTLQQISGEIRLTRGKPFSNIEPIAVFDAGGHRLQGGLVTVNATGHIDATFETPTDAITVGSKARAKKRFKVEGVTPTVAFSEIEQAIKDRGIEGAEYTTPTESRDMKEGQEVTKYSGSIRNGSVLVGDKRVSLDITVEGNVRSSSRERARETDENLPAERRQVTVEYGKTGVQITCRGTEQEIVDEYVSDLRDELRMSLESVAEVM